MKEQYNIELVRPDLAISAANIREPLEFEFAFYVDPARGGSKKILDDVTASMILDFQNVPGVKFSQRK